MSFSSLFRRRLAFLLESLDIQHKEFAEKICSHDPYKEHITPGLVSHWLSGKRDPTPYLDYVVQALMPALNRAYRFKRGDLIQEVSDWYGLLGLPNSDKQVHTLFPDWCAPMVAGNLPRLQLPAFHVERPELGAKLIYKLLLPNPENGLLARNGLALTGWPGVGKSTLALELLHQARPFFTGGILFGNLRRASPQQILVQWAKDLKIPAPESQYPTNLASVVNKKVEALGGRWICFLDGVNVQEELTDLLLPQTWVLITTQGTQPLLPHGLEDWAFGVPAFTKEEATLVFQKRLGSCWEKYNDSNKVKGLHTLVEGLPMAISILAGVVHSRGWEYTLSRFEDEMRIISTVNLPPGNLPELSLRQTIEFALDTLDNELRSLLAVLSSFAPGIPMPEFMLEMFLKMLGKKDKPGAWRVNLETLRESGLLEVMVATNDPDVRYWRMHRLVSLYLSGMMSLEDRTDLYRKMKQVLSQHALAGQAHPCLPVLVLPAIKRRLTAWPHIKLVHQGLIRLFQSDLTKQNWIGMDHDIFQTDALYLSRFIHALFGPDEALEYLDPLLPLVPAQPKIMLTWAMYKFSTDDPTGIIEKLQQLLQHTTEDPTSSYEIRVHAYLAWAYLLSGQSGHACPHIEQAEWLTKQLRPPLDARVCFVQAETSFVQGKKAAYEGNLELAEIFYTQALLDYCWPDLPVELKTRPGVTLGNPHAEEAGRHYPWLVRLMETIWTLVEFRERAGLHWEAYELAREATRFALSMPWVYALDHLYLLIRLASQTGGKGLAKPVLNLLERGEPFLEQPPCRSKLGAVFLIADPSEAIEKLVKLAHSFRHNGWRRWAKEAQKLAENFQFVNVSDEGLRYVGDFEKAVKALAAWQDQLGLPGFSSEDEPLPKELPW